MLGRRPFGVLAIAIAIAMAAAAGAPASAGTAGTGNTGGFVKPGEREKCPVCGMFVAKYPDWTAQIRFTDGSREVFDGAKDLLRYLGDMGGHGGRHRPEDVAAVFVTDYYSLEPVDGTTALYVAGSDVYGPMGKELIPFSSRAEAQEFLRDHRGTRIVGFEQARRELESLVE